MDLSNIHNLPDEALVPEAGAAAFLAVDERTPAAWRLRRQGPAFVRIGRAVRYRMADLRSWVASRRVVAEA
jgi:hypothetical protein